MFIKRLSPLFQGILIMLVPIVVSAQSVVTPPTESVCQRGVSDFTDFLQYLIQCLIGSLITRLIIAAAVIVFMFGVLRFILRAGQGDTDYATNLSKYLGWSIVALFIMLSVWGIIYLIGASLGIGQGGVAPIPTLPVGPS